MVSLKPKYRKKNVVVIFFMLVFQLVCVSQNTTIEERLKAIDSIYGLAVKQDNDSLKNEMLKQCIKLNFKKKKWKAFNFYRFKHIELSYKIKDTLSRAKTYEYSGAYFGKMFNTDSTYYYYTKSFLEYDAIKDSLNAGLMLLNLAIIQKNYRDYSGSKYKSYSALKYLKNKAKPRRIASVHNNLGLIYQHTKDYKKAIEHHEKALKLRKGKNQNSIYIAHSYNNIGDVYLSNNNYKKAIKYFAKGMQYDSLFLKHPNVQATLLDNFTYARFKNGEQNNIINSFSEALNIRENTNNLYGIAVSYIHLAEYYKIKNNLSEAINYAEQAENITRKIKHNQNYLEALGLLINLYDGEKSKQLFNQYESIRDSLEIADKKQRDSFSEIELLVDEKNTLISKQNKVAEKRKLLIIVLVLIAVALLIFTVYFFVERHKHKQLLQLSYHDLAVIKKKLSQIALDNHDKTNEYLTAFHEVLQKKYNLTPALIEYWILRANRKSKKEIAEQLFISENSVIDRRKRLIKSLEKIVGDYKKPRSFLVDLYTEELSDFLKLVVK